MHLYLHELNRLKNQILKTGYFVLQGSPRKCINETTMCNQAKVSMVGF